MQENQRILITGRIGYGVTVPFAGNLQVFEIGKFRVRIALGLFNSRNLRPVTAGDFRQPINIDVLSSSFDSQSETDFDELPFGQSLTVTLIEGFIAGVVADVIQDEIKNSIREKIDDAVDSILASQSANIARAETVLGRPAGV